MTIDRELVFRVSFLPHALCSSPPLISDSKDSSIVQVIATGFQAAVTYIGNVSSCAGLHVAGAGSTQCV